MQVDDQRPNDLKDAPHSADNAEELTGDWRDRGHTSIYPVLTEHAAAEYLWRQDDGDPTWYGGHNKGFDIESKGVRYEVKTAWFNTAHPDRLYFPAPSGGFDAGVCDVIIPVMLKGTSLSYGTSSGGGHVLGRYTEADMWLLDVSVVNKLLHYEAKARSWVTLAQVADYRVSSTSAS